jgi:hypothetical protein
MTTTLPASRVLDIHSLENDLPRFFEEGIQKAVAANGPGWHVQLDLHGNDLDGPFETEEEALERAEDAEINGETSGNF